MVYSALNLSKRNARDSSPSKTLKGQPTVYLYNYTTPHACLHCETETEPCVCVSALLQLFRSNHILAARCEPKALGTDILAAKTP